MKTIKNLLKDESGATAIEYGLIAALVSVAILLILSQLGDQLVTTFTKIKTQLETANTP
ncbi:MAG: Flp family type IVb pilin [Geminicoccaceae bacterium]|nr:Flp family type IVb pilin [Geminicoccaceae bacterium]